ncbi:MAG: succinyldiaminopimelate transaminase [Pseudomonadales bacterium]|jgi:N-succinyldiaminopimelate aminotransferase|nr:succinyldiaminopimelate transaminase [Pseudomonadales bacterium]MDP6471697.1 succinyldiaminopimelate transaminase [Pseudomonadales bacterium]MDP6972211.1 succinyldiaminopimelate transaminase [Pseudomonadales bacterium]
MNPKLEALQPYPFERLNALRAGITPNGAYPHTALSIGEPKHAAPAFVIEALTDAEALTTDIGVYPATRGSEDLRETISTWLEARFEARTDPNSEVLPVAGTREALFSFAQAVTGRKPDPVVVIPNPFYQIYEGACLLAGAQPWFVNASRDNDYQGDFESIPEAIWKRTELLYLCSPGNPTGKVVPGPTQRWLIEQAHRYDFVIAADECYSEIFQTTPPTGLLSVSNAMGNPHYARCVVFHSLSKRSSLPGLRSGFVAGDSRVLSDYFLYRTYEGCALPAHTQRVSALAWADEQHVRENQAAYRAKFNATVPLLKNHLDLYLPDGGFYLWAHTEGDDTKFAAELFRDCNISVLPGSFLAREWRGENPGASHVRIALVAPVADCVVAAERIAKWLEAR